MELRFFLVILFAIVSRQDLLADGLHDPDQAEKLVVRRVDKDLEGLKIFFANYEKCTPGAASKALETMHKKWKETASDYGDVVRLRKMLRSAGLYYGPIGTNSGPGGVDEKRPSSSRTGRPSGGRFAAAGIVAGGFLGKEMDFLCHGYGTVLPEVGCVHEGESGLTLINESYAKFRAANMLRQEAAEKVKKSYKEVSESSFPKAFALGANGCNMPAEIIQRAEKASKKIPSEIETLIGYLEQTRAGYAQFPAMAETLSRTCAKEPAKLFCTPPPSP